MQACATSSGKEPLSSLSASESKYTLLLTTFLLYLYFTSGLVTICLKCSEQYLMLVPNGRIYDTGLELNIDAASLDAIQEDNPHN